MSVAQKRGTSTSTLHGWSKRWMQFDKKIGEKKEKEKVDAKLLVTPGNILEYNLQGYNFIEQTVVS